MKNTDSLACIRNTILKYLILLYPILISFEGMIPLVSTAITFLCLTLLFLNTLLYYKSWSKYLLIILLLAIGGMSIEITDNHTNHIKYLLLFFMAYDGLKTELYNRVFSLIERYKRHLLLQLWFVLLINIFLLLLGKGYSTNYSEDWGTSAFQGVYSDPHQAAYRIAGLIIILICISAIKFRWSHFIILGGYEILVLMTGARTPAIIAIALGLVYCLEHRTNIKAVGKFATEVVNCIPYILIGCLFIYVAVFHTSFGQKIMNTMDSQSFDNGRETLRSLDMLLFAGSSWFKKLFGNGTEAVLQFHGQNSWTGGTIWSHNDFMQILCGMGAIMLVVYMAQWLIILKKIPSGKIGLMYILCWGSFIGVAFLNGMYIHPRFVFISPLIFSYLKQRGMRKENEEKNIRSFL